MIRRERHGCRPHGLAFCGHVGLTGPCGASMAWHAWKAPPCGLQPTRHSSVGACRALSPFVLSVAQRSRSTAPFPPPSRGRAGWGCGGGFFLRGFARNCRAGGCPAASHFLLLRQKKVTKEKATRVRRLSGDEAAGQLPCAAHVGGRASQTRCAQTAKPDIPRRRCAARRLSRESRGATACGE